MSTLTLPNAVDTRTGAARRTMIVTAAQGIGAGVTQAFVERG
jgi:hypothetical protein